MANNFVTKSQIKIYALDTSTLRGLSHGNSLVAKNQTPTQDISSVAKFVDNYIAGLILELAFAIYTVKKVCHRSKEAKKSQRKQFR